MISLSTPERQLGAAFGVHRALDTTGAMIGPLLAFGLCLASVVGLAFDPNQVAANTSTLITKDHVDAMLGSCTPALVNAGAVIADRSGVPLVTGCDPLIAFTSVKKWTWAWDIFFLEPELASAPFKTLQAWGSKTNKKVAIIAAE